LPFKSKAQNAALHAKAARGEFPKAKLKEWESKTDYGSLPEHVKPKKENRKRTKVKGKAKRGRKY